MRDFLENLPMNHWLTYVFFAIGLISYLYVAYFFFSKEGRDERGRSIFASASAITFILMIIISQIYDYHAVDWMINSRAYSFLNWFQLSVLGFCQFIGIHIFRKMR